MTMTKADWDALNAEFDAELEAYMAEWEEILTDHVAKLDGESGDVETDGGVGK